MPAWTRETVQAANQGNMPRSLADVGGEQTLAFARRSANQSPQAREALSNLAP